MDVEEALPFDNCESPERRPARAAILRGSVKSDDPVHSQPSGERPFSGLPKTLASAAREVSVGTLASLLVLVMNVGSAGIVFHEADESDALHALNGNVADAVTICLLCTTVGGLAISLSSGVPALVSADAFMGAFYVTLARNVIGGHPEAAFGTVVVAIAFCSALQGVAFYLLGAARVGRAVQFVPTPVVSGYLASIGYLLLNGTSSMLTGCTLGSVGCLAAAPALPHTVIVV